MANDFPALWGGRDVADELEVESDSDTRAARGRRKLDARDRIMRHVAVKFFQKAQAIPVAAMPAEAQGNAGKERLNGLSLRLNSVGDQAAVARQSANRRQPVVEPAARFEVDAMISQKGAGI